MLLLGEQEAAVSFTHLRFWEIRKCMWCHTPAGLQRTMAPLPVKIAKPSTEPRYPKCGDRF
jgi:hypothetical protein